MRMLYSSLVDWKLISLGDSPTSNMTKITLKQLGHLSKGLASISDSISSLSVIDSQDTVADIKKTSTIHQDEFDELLSKVD